MRCRQRSSKVSGHAAAMWDVCGCCCSTPPAGYGRFDARRVWGWAVLLINCYSEDHRSGSSQFRRQAVDWHGRSHVHASGVCCHPQPEWRRGVRWLHPHGEPQSGRAERGFWHKVRACMHPHTTILRFPSLAARQRPSSCQQRDAGAEAQIKVSASAGTTLRMAALLLRSSRMPSMREQKQSASISLPMCRPLTRVRLAATASSCSMPAMTNLANSQ